MPAIVRRAAQRAGAVALTLAATAAAVPGAAAAAATPPGPSAAAAQAAAQLVARRPAVLRPSRHDAFVRRPVIATQDGLQYVPYERTYKGLPVVGGDFVVVTRSGRVLSTSVAQGSAIDLRTSPTLTAANAAQIAASRLPGPSTPQGTRLVVLATAGPPALAYESVVAGHRGTLPSRLHVFVDAHSADVLLTDDDVKAGSGSGWINGPPPLSIDTSGAAGAFSMTDPLRPRISCRNDVTNAVLTGPDDDWGNGDGTDIETGCVDALWGVQQQWNMLSQWLGRDGIDGNGGGFPLFVGGNFQGAFTDGLSVSIGHNPALKWVSSLDIVGHEYGHLIDINTPGGFPNFTVAEFTADVFGALSEAYAGQSEPYDAPDYSVGEEIDLRGSGPIRYMHQPSLLGHPDCYSSAISTMSSHVAAGPGNHWFYLLAEGSAPANGQPASPTCDGSAITGLGIRTAGRIFYNAMLSKTSGMTYPKYRSATLMAASNLFAGDCTAYETVKAAWDAVGVPAQPTDLACGATPVPIAIDDAYSALLLFPWVGERGLRGRTPRRA